MVERGANTAPKQEPTAFLTIPEVARLSRLHQSTVRNLIARGELPGVRFGRVWRVPVAAYERFISSQLVESVPLVHAAGAFDPTGGDFLDLTSEEEPEDAYDDGAQPAGADERGTLAAGPPRKGEKHVEMNWS